MLHQMTPCLNIHHIATFRVSTRTNSSKKLVWFKSFESQLGGGPVLNVLIWDNCYMSSSSPSSSASCLDVLYIQRITKIQLIKNDMIENEPELAG